MNYDIITTVFSIEEYFIRVDCNEAYVDWNLWEPGK